MHTTLFIHYKAYVVIMSDLKYSHCMDNQVDDDIRGRMMRMIKKMITNELTLKIARSKSNVGSKNLKELTKKKK